MSKFGITIDMPLPARVPAATIRKSWPLYLRYSPLYLPTMKAGYWLNIVNPPASPQP